MAKPSSLEGSLVPLQQLRAEYSQTFSRLLNEVPHPLHLVISTTVSPILSAVLDNGNDLMRANGVQDISELNPRKKYVENQRSIVYLIRPTIASTRELTQAMKNVLNKSAVSFHVFFLPRRNRLCEEVFRMESTQICIHDFPLAFIPIDTNVLTLQDASLMSDCYLHSNQTGLQNVAHAIAQMEAAFGDFRSVHLKGQMSKRVWQLVMELKGHRGIPNGSQQQIDSLILLDRKVDIASMMVTPLTYEGLISELFGIQNFVTQLPTHLWEDKEDSNEQNREEEKKPVPIGVNSDDHFYNKIRDLHLEKIASTLQEEANTVRTEYNHFRETSQDASIAEVHSFVKKVPELKKNFQSLNHHVNVVDHVSRVTKGEDFREQWKLERAILEGYDMINSIQDLIMHQNPFCKVLRLLCLHCTIQSGIKEPHWASIRKLIVQTYGYEVALTLENLEKAGLVFQQHKPSKFKAVKEKLQLIVDTPNVCEPTDISYATSGYAPLSIRLVEALLEKGNWSSISAALHCLPGPSASISQINIAEPSTQGKKVVLLCIIGGLSFLEMAAIRLFNRQSKSHHILMSTTHLMNGNDFVETFVQSVANGLVNQS